MGGEDDYWYYEQEAAMEEFLNESLKGISEGNVRSYLGTHGDAIQNRIELCIKQAKQLHGHGYYGPAVTVASTAIELTIRFMLIRPLVQGAFLSDEWAEIVSSRIGTGRSAEDRAILPSILKQWGIDISSFSLSNDSHLWETIKQRVFPKRNTILHAGESADQSDAELSIECAESLLNEVVKMVAVKLGFTLDTTGKWSQIKGEAGTPGEDGYRSWGQIFEPKSPFR